MIVSVLFLTILPDPRICCLVEVLVWLRHCNIKTTLKKLMRTFDISRCRFRSKLFFIDLIDVDVEINIVGWRDVFLHDCNEEGVKQQAA